MWAQQHYALQKPIEPHTQSEERIRFGTTRALRSAASHFYLWDRQIAHPDQAMRDPSSRRVYLANGVSPTDAVGYGLMATGMAQCMGDQSKPPIALTLQQILWIMRHLEDNWNTNATHRSRCNTAAAAVVNLLGWLGWLHLVETFSLTWGDITITRPQDGPRIGLPRGVGAIELRLLPETKSSRTKVADVVISYLCGSGLAPGLWLE